MSISFNTKSDDCITYAVRYNQILVFLYIYSYNIVYIYIILYYILYRLQACILYRDQGPGISTKDQMMLFKPFVQIRPGELQDGIYYICIDYLCYILNYMIIHI